MPALLSKGHWEGHQISCGLASQAFIVLPALEPSQVSFCKSCRLLHREPHITASFAGTHCMMSIQGLPARYSRIPYSLILY
jgi:hypothetical protein